MKVIVFGSRTWADWNLIHTVLSRAPITLLVHGDCPRGADAIAKAWAIAHGVPETGERYAARWTDADGNLNYGAGMARNLRMARENTDADCALGFRARGRSNGTDNMRGCCKRLSIPGFIFDEFGGSCAL